MPTFWKDSLKPLPKKEKIAKIPKPIPKVSEKKKKRLKHEGKESDVFLEIWLERPHICEICGNAIKEPLTWCFSHKLGKGRYPSLRLNKENLLLVCSEECHHKHDAMNKGRDLEILKELGIVSVGATKQSK